MSKNNRSVVRELVALLVGIVIFVVPFIFIVTMAIKSRGDAANMRFSWPRSFDLFVNVRDVIDFRDNLLLRAMRNSLVVTVLSVTGVVLMAAMVGFVAQRRADRLSRVANWAVFAGLIVPPAVVPTIYVLQELHLFKSLSGLIMVEVAITLPFGVLLTRAFMASIPNDIDQAAIIDGARGFTLFWKVIMPLLRPVLITLIVTSSVAVYNDFVNPIYFTPGEDNTTAQLTLFNFQSQFESQWNLLFADVLLITIPPLIMFIIFNRRMVEGITAGAVKG